MGITIDLDLIREACPVEISNEVIHGNAYKKIARSISEIYSRIEYAEEHAQRTHDVIGVFGRRGTGKTTVLISVLDLIKNKSLKLEQTTFWEELSGSKVTAEVLFPLPPVDPTMMGSKEHMLLRVVNLIRSSVEPHVEHISAQGQCDIEQYPAWQLSFRRIVQGIVNLEVTGETKQDWFYDEFAASEKMNAIVHAEDLEKNFHDFIKLSVQLLKKEAFVLAIDDMDTNPGAAWASLECIRKYFTSPRLIVMLGGDLDMFTEIIRAEQRRFFDFQSFSALGSFDSRPQMHIETLVEQYLLKLIPMLHRVHLYNFLWSAREELGQYYIYDSITLKKFNETMVISYFLQFLNKDFGLHLSVLMESYDNILLDTPLRTAREIFNLLVESYLQLNDKDNRSSKQRRAEMVHGLARIFTNALHQFGYSDPELKLQQLETPHGITDLLDKLVLHGLLLSNNDDLHPRQHPHWLGASLAVVQGSLTHAIQNSPGVSFHYLLKISVFKELTQRQGMLEASDQSYRLLRDNLRLADGTALNNTGKFLAGLAPCMKNAQGYAHGLGTILLTIPDYYINFPAWGSIYPLAGIYRRQTMGGDEPAFSIWSFLGLMGDVLLASSDILLEEVVRALPYPQTIASLCTNKETALFRQEPSSTPTHLPQSDTAPNEISKRAIGIKQLLAVWRDDVRKRMNNEGSFTVSAGIFPQIAQRYINSLHILDKNMNLGDDDYTYAVLYCKNCALLFLHAVLVEESRLVTNASPLRSLSLADPINIEENFLHNCITVKNFIEHINNPFETMMQLFSIICTYPIWPMLLGNHLINNILHSLGLFESCSYYNLSKSKLDASSVAAVKSVLQEVHNTNGNPFEHRASLSLSADKNEELFFRKFHLRAAKFMKVSTSQ